jgi:uncharacterized membrane protein HdeD (DUF308 family)
MRIIRYSTIILFLLTGILHLNSSLRNLTNPNAIPALSFGVIYFAIGILLFFKVQYALILGIVFPCIGLGASLIVAGFHNWTAMTTIIYSIDVVVIFCCIVLSCRRNKEKKALC